jgi:hypothetical protein
METSLLPCSWPGFRSPRLCISSPPLQSPQELQILIVDLVTLYLVVNQVSLGIILEVLVYLAVVRLTSYARASLYYNIFPLPIP